VKENIGEKVVEILLNNGFHTDNGSIFDELGQQISLLDFIDFVEITSLFELAFGITINNEDFELIEENTSSLANLRIILARKLPGETISELDPVSSLFYD
jgi:hypothetical protein